MDPRGEPATLLYQTSVIAISILKRALTPTEKCRSQPSSKTVLFAVKEAITENYNWSKCRDELIVGCLAPVGTSTTQFIHLRLRKEHKKTIRTRGPES